MRCKTMRCNAVQNAVQDNALQDAVQNAVQDNAVQDAVQNAVQDNAVQCGAECGVAWVATSLFLMQPAWVNFKVLKASSKF
jgi:hypothetical protein